MPVGHAKSLLDLLTLLRSSAGAPSLHQIASRIPPIDGTRPSRGYLSEVFRGLRCPSGDRAAAIAKALHGTIDDQRRAREYAEKAAVERQEPKPSPGLPTVTAGPVARSAYLRQVEQLAPPDLEERDAELAELACFCRSDGPHSYVWWRADAWAGKTALLAWFVLHPPPGVRLVPFFITARLSGQDNRSAFAEVVMEQLAELLGRPLPLYAPATRDAHLLGLLTDAALTCRQRGERLALVIDGLDEDRGEVSGRATYSIAGVLPRNLPPGLRVVVAGRPNPPIPADVPPGHPLRDPAIVRPLARSARAAALRTEMQRDLAQLLRGGQSAQDLLGLITAAGGGLSGADLAALTGLGDWEIEEQLHTVAGRSFSRRPSRWEPDDAPEVYLLGHEDLQQMAFGYIGTARILAYRERLHAWADEWAGRGWPRGTPEYLLRGYFQLLLSTASHADRDVPADAEDRLIKLALDDARHDRMLDLTGGDQAALVEITAAQDVVLAEPEPDLTTMALLAQHRDDLHRRNAGIPVELPGIWARLGNLPRAEALAMSAGDTSRQAAAMAGIAAAAYSLGDQDLAAELTRSIRTLVASLEPQMRQGLLPFLADQFAEHGEPSKAEDTARTIDDPAERGLALVMLTCTLADRGDPTLALRLADEAVAGALAAPTRLERVRQVALIAYAMARCGESALAASRAAQAAALVDQGDGRPATPEELAWIAGALANGGELDRAEEIARAIATTEQMSTAVAFVAEARAFAGEYPAALRLAELLPEDHQRDTLHSLVANVADLRGDLELVDRLVPQLTPQQQAQLRARQALRILLQHDHDRARIVAAQAEDAGRRIHTTTQNKADLRSLIDLITAVSAAQNRRFADELTRRARRLATGIADPSERDRALRDLARASALAGNLDHAEHLAESVEQPGTRVDALVMVAAEATKHNRPERALVLADRAADLAATSNIADSPWIWARIAEVLASGGSLDRALVISRGIAQPQQRSRALSAVAREAAASGDSGSAATVFDEAEQAAHLADQGERSWCLATVAEAAAQAGDTIRSERLGTAITDPFQRDRAKHAAVAALGTDDQAVAMARTIEAPTHRVLALFSSAGIDEAAASARSVVHDTQRAWLLSQLANRVAPEEAGRYIAEALRWGPWTGPLNALARCAPTATRILAERILERRR